MSSVDLIGLMQNCAYFDTQQCNPFDTLVQRDECTSMGKEDFNSLLLYSDFYPEFGVAMASVDECAKHRLPRRARDWSAQTRHCYLTRAHIWAQAGEKARAMKGDWALWGDGQLTPTQKEFRNLSYSDEYNNAFRIAKDTEERERKEREKRECVCGGMRGHGVVKRVRSTYTTVWIEEDTTDRCKVCVRALSREGMRDSCGILHNVDPGPAPSKHAIFMASRRFCTHCIPGRGGNKETFQSVEETVSELSAEEPVEETVSELSAEESDDEGLVVTLFKLDGSQYYRDADNTLYDPVSQEPVGKYNPETQKFEELPEESDDEED